MPIDIEYYLTYYKVPDNFKPFLRASGTIIDKHNVAAIKLKKSINDALKIWCKEDYAKIAFNAVYPLGYLEYGQVVMHPDVRVVLENSIPAFLEEANDPVKGKKYATEKRQLSAANKQTKISIPKYIKLVTNVDELLIKDDVIRKAAELVQAGDTAMTLVICEKPEDYIEMFKVNVVSCMRFTGHYASPYVAEFLKQGFHPGSWYHFTPHSRGFMIYQSGNLIARGMIYRTDVTKDEWTHYGDIKSASYGSEHLVHQLLKQKGFKLLEGYASTIAPFEIPALEYKGDYFAPLPHCDRQSKDFSVCFDKKRKVFCFEPPVSKTTRNGYSHEYTYKPNTTPITYTYTYPGYIPASKICQI